MLAAATVHGGRPAGWAGLRASRPPSRDSARVPAPCGLPRHQEATPPPHRPRLQVTIDIYLKALQGLIARKHFTVYVHPALPVLDPTRAIVKTFNTMLQASLGMRVVVVLGQGEGDGAGRPFWRHTRGTKLKWDVAMWDVEVITLSELQVARVNARVAFRRGLRGVPVWGGGGGGVQG